MVCGARSHVSFDVQHIIATIYYNIEHKLDMQLITINAVAGVTSKMQFSIIAIELDWPVDGSNGNCCICSKKLNFNLL
jgi:hypothetical protein